MAKSSTSFTPGQSGNPNGRPKTGTAEIELVRAAIEKVGKEKGKTLWLHLVERSFVDDTVLVALAKKFVPDMTKEVGEISPQFIIVRANEKITIEKNDSPK